MDYNWGVVDDMKEKYTAKVSALAIINTGQCGHTHNQTHTLAAHTKI